MPLGLVLVERSAPNPERLELLYRNRSGLRILLVQVPTRGPLAAPADMAQAVMVADSAVITRQDPRPGAVLGLIWERQGVVFELLVLDAPSSGLLFEDARQLVEALIMDQEATP